MKLHYWRSSPHSCKVLAVLDLLGFGDSIQLIPTHPWDPESDLSIRNPLEKIPTLVLDEGWSLYDSNVISRYLASVAPFAEKAEELYPAEGERKWISQRQEALAGGIMEAAVLRLLEERARPSYLQSQTWIQRQQNKIRRSLEVLENDADQHLSSSQPDIGHVSLAIALAYIAFRYPSYVWHLEYPKLTTWYQSMLQVPEIAKNVPKEIHSLPTALEKID